MQHGVAAALADLRTLAQHPVYVLNVAGTAVYTGAPSLCAAAWIDIDGAHAMATEGSCLLQCHVVLPSAQSLLPKVHTPLYTHLCATAS